MTIGQRNICEPDPPPSCGACPGRGAPLYALRWGALKEPRARGGRRRGRWGGRSARGQDAGAKSALNFLSAQLRLVADGLADGDDGISPLVNRLADLPFQCVFTGPRALLSGKSNRCML